METSEKVVLDNWTYIAITYDGTSKEWKIYQNNEVRSMYLKVKYYYCQTVLQQHNRVANHNHGLRL